MVGSTGRRRTGNYHGTQMVGAGLFRQWGIAGIVYQANIESQPKSESGDLFALSKAAVSDAESEGRSGFFSGALFHPLMAQALNPKKLPPARLKTIKKGY